MEDPRTCRQLVGHDAAWAEFLSVIRSGRLHHAWLLTGPEGVGKATMAFMMARTLLGARDHASAVGRRVSAGTHADLLVIARGVNEKSRKKRKKGAPPPLRREIVADDIRPIGTFLHRTAAEGGWRVVIVDGADYMNRTAANAILKILEEPPERAILILTAAMPGRLLPTIRSRCRVLNLAPMDNAAMHAVLSAMPDAPPPDRLDAIIPLAHGAPGRALELLHGGGAVLAGLVEQVMAGQVTPAGAYDVAAMVQEENGFSVFFDLLCDAISDRACDLARNPVAPQARDLRPARMALLWQDMARLRAETEQFNLDEQQAILTALARVSET
ncbi:DNA polymerase III subunit delta' [Komagataeibacter rhaeticus]|uniref:DNA polymerase III subunit delta n=1 Tax=Komagataeibacter rhaeticus TaxID=215221 RepID=A0A181CBD0_9PROT|nr:DNA polymerase III subunit delta' [Komagataeibacter rhaeticus]ATU72463.1 DNA polymerase III subunit delta' [Komagataeibacter xylinus]KDU96958.1 DNA polymerase III subunit delta' [Komagataeibacter rhaeticus AF1]MBL7238816.1 DNA polymerase III subunit delta' [Komagataeibacter rhaeticus]PYD52938.1 DNA polymerase III subunit delta' [Komagataeibacter rhaeticus]QIP35624.1 DNA polymerase III subunit delta' [Komagataeibacter rhaeticus]